MTGVTELKIPYGVTEIVELGFENCSSLTTVIMSDSVTTIGDTAFENCKDLENITIPDSITKIGDDAFKKCSSLSNEAREKILQINKNAKVR